MHSLPKKDLSYSGKDLCELKNNKIAEPTVDLEDNSCYNRYKLVKLMTDIFREMTNFKLLSTNKPFALIVAANFFVFVGYFLPFIYIPIRGRELDIKNIAIVLSVIGK